MSEPAELLDPIVDEAQRVLAEMKGTKDLQQRLTQSEILRNLCQSLGVFFDLMSNGIDEDDFEDLLDDEED